MPEGFSSAARLAALVTQMAVITVLGGLLGRELDARLATTPWLLVVGLFGGFALGMVALFQGITRLGPNSASNPGSNDDDERPPDPPL